MNELPLYKLVNMIRAAKITALYFKPDARGETMIMELDCLERGTVTRDVSTKWASDCNARIGTYFVVNTDGDQGVLGSAVIEEDYARIPDHIPLESQPEYMRMADRLATERLGFYSEVVKRFPDSEGPPEPRTTGLSFGEALVALREGKKVARPSWDELENKIVRNNSGSLLVEDRYGVRWGTILLDDAAATDWYIVTGE